ncbi:molybdenum ABC transporter ATP-binding protein [Pseudogemmobacter humi]|uniref:Sulfate/thiosulfate import ATP-binding protein CysA n=1 Tax=Pseudogemmobacter humi TaxID=2483812 RepID=A0A3P5WS14_9RHOB|nr:molybdenum ABC transporter ATP-binding protein [Pseudogemmobacter humi]VDC24355.1 Sulfate/thiosulfate import ATP-binding protein CysA [Pseudogemmobacter humi]
MTLSVSLHHRYPDFTLDVAFTAPPGVTALFGRSGSGKTTVVNAVAGLLRPGKGRIALDETVLLDTERRIFLPPHRRRIGYVFQEGRLFPHLTVRQNLLYGRWFAPKGAARADFDLIVDLLGIGALLARRPGALSGGEKSRVALGRAILSDPGILLMDEPLAALDEDRKSGILPYLERLRDTLSLPILYVSHSAAEVARLATTVVLIEAGRVSAAGPAAAILSDPLTASGVGLRDMGAVLTARVEAQEEDGLTRLATAAGPVWLPGVGAAPGRSLRLRILAQDVMLARARPEGISALNILPCTVRDLTPAGDGGVLVRLSLGEEDLLARITARSAAALGLAPGQPVHAVLKAVAVAPDSIGT